MVLIQSLDDQKRKFINILSILVIFSSLSVILFLSPVTFLKKPEVFQQSPGAGITIDVNKKVTAISPTFFGISLSWMSYGMENSAGGYTHADQVSNLLGDLHLGVVRFGGEDYEWKWKLNSEADTPPRYNQWFSYGMGINKYIDFVRKTNSSVYYTVNMQERHLVQDVCGHPNVVNVNEYPGTVTETRELAQYFKTKIPDKTVYWALAGEPWIQGDCQWKQPDYVRRALEHAQAIREIYPDARFSWPIPGWDPNWQKQWIDYYAQNVPDTYLNAVRYHYYPSDLTLDKYLTIDELAKKDLESIQNMIKQTGKNMDLDIGEFGIVCDGKPECATVGHNLGMAQLYMEFLLHGIKFAPYNAPVMETDKEDLHSWALLVTGGGPAWARVNKPPRTQPAYYIQKLLAQHTGTEIIESSTQENRIDILTTKKGNTIYTLVINKNNAVKHLPITATSGITLTNPARVFVVGKGSVPHNLSDYGAKQISTGYVQVKGNITDFYAAPYSVSVVEIDYKEVAKKPLYRGWCPQEGEYLLTDQKKELEDKNCEQIQEIGKVSESQIEDTYPLERYWMKNMLEHYQTANPADKEHISNTPTYGAQVDKVLGYVYITNKEGTIPLYQMWCGEGWLKKHFFTANETEKQNVTDSNSSWKCKDVAPVGYLLP